MATATYRFIVPGRYIGQTVTVFDQSTSAQVASGTVGSDGTYSVALTQGDYYATTPDGRYVDADSQGATSSDGANTAQAAQAASFVPATVLTGSGIDPTGTADSYTALQAKLTTAVPGQEFFLPAGQYKTTAPLVISAAGVTLRGAGRSVAVLRPNFRNSALTGGYIQVNASNVTIESLGVNGPGDGTLTTAAVNIGSNSGTVGANAGTITGVVVRNCHLQNISGHGVIGQWEASRVQVIGNLIENCGSTSAQDGHAISVVGPHWVVAHNVIRAQRMRGIEVFGGSIYGDLTYNITVSNNLIDTCTSYGLVLCATHEVNITGNVITNGATHGIYSGLGGTLTVTDVNITGNVVKGNTGTGMFFDAPCQDINVTGNNVSNNLQHGIVFGAAGSSTILAAGIVISGNLCARNKNTAGILLQNTKDYSVTGNVCRENGFGGGANTGYGIFLFTTNTAGVVTGNRCYDRQGTPTQKNGLICFAPYDRLVVVGNMFNNNGDTVDWFTDNPTTAGSLVVRSNSGSRNALTTLTAPAIPTSTTAQANNFATPVFVHVTGGTVTGIAINGQATGLTSGTFHLEQSQTITLTYSVAPTWVWAQA